MSAPAVGFRRAPVTKTVMFLTGCGSLAHLAGGHGPLLWLKLKHATSGQLWRFVTCHFVFLRPGQLMFGMVLLYHFRAIERQLGSRKFAAFGMLTTTLFTTGHLLLLPDTPIAGPLGLAFSSLALFYALVPPSPSPVRLLGFPLSSKAMVYFSALQVALAAPMASVASCALGVACGALYLVEGLRLGSVLVPKRIGQVCSSLLGWLVDPAPTTRPHGPLHPALQGQGGARGRVGGEALVGDHAAFAGGVRRRGPAAAPAPQVQLREEDVAVLMQLGFEREQVVQALTRANGDVSRASNFLLDA